MDTSIWIDHLRYGDERLAGLLEDGQVLCHRFVVGELACGALRNRDEILSLLSALPSTRVAEQDEVLKLIAQRRLTGRGLGWIDMHLLTSAVLDDCTVWTFDKALRAVAQELKLAAS